MQEQKYEVVNYREAMAKAAEVDMSTMSPDVNRISFKGGQIACDGQNIGTKIICYILARRRVNAWYLNKYVPDKIEAPHCWAVFNKEDEMIVGPDPRSIAPQSDRCINCPKDAFGSSRDGRRGKDCSNRWRISIVPAGMPNNDGSYKLFDAPNIDAQPLYTCHIPVASGKAFENYVFKTANRCGRPSFGVVTEMVVVPDARTQFKIQFNLIHVPEEDDILGVLYNKAIVADSEIGFGFDSSPQPEQSAPPQNPTGRF